MAEKILLNKRNTVVYKNGEVLPAVFDYSIRIKSDSEGLYEIFSGEPWQIIKENIKYGITLKQYAESFVSAEEKSFTLTFAAPQLSAMRQNNMTPPKNEASQDFTATQNVGLPQESVSFEGCRILGTETTYDTKGNLVLISTISAERMC